MTQTWSYNNEQILPLLARRHFQVFGTTYKPKKGEDLIVQVLPGYNASGPSYMTGVAVWDLPLTLQEISDEWNRVFSDEYEQILKPSEIRWEILTDDEGDVVDVVYEFEMFD